jgi:hypothetical protein
MSRRKSAMRVGRANKTGFRNGPRGVKSRVSTSPIYDAPRERAFHGAVASAALVGWFRCLRRRSLASVRGRREAATLCHKRKRRAYLTTRSPSRDGHCPISGFTDSVVPATGPLTKWALSGPLQNRVSLQFTHGRVAAPFLLSSSGNSFRRPTSDARSRRSCAPRRLWPVSCPAVWRRLFPNASAPRNV